MILLLTCHSLIKPTKKPVIKNGQWIYQSDPYSRRTNVRNQKESGSFSPKIFPRQFAFIHLHRALHSDAHMRSSVVIKVNHTIDLIDRLFFIPVHFLLVYPFDLEDPVLSFRHGVVCRLISFCHAYPYVMLHEAADVSLAGVL